MYPTEPALLTKWLVTIVCLALTGAPCLARDEHDEFIRVAPDGWHFETAKTHKPFVPFGGVYFDPATYVDKPFPRFLVIEQFDEQRTDRHFAQIAEIGGNLVRISISVKTFSPEYKKINPKAFEKLDKIIALAKKHGLRVVLDPFGAWEGMPDWIPWTPAVFADEKMTQGMEFLFSQFAQRYRNEPAVFSYLIADEPTFPWTFHGIPSGFGEYVRTLYGSEENLKRDWNDYPHEGERWDTIIPPRDEIAPGSRRLYDYQTLREDITTRFVERIARVIRSKDSNHMISLANIQWAIPLRYVIDAPPFNDLVKPSGYQPFNPQKIGKYVDYLDIHSYNWWDGKEAEFTQAMGRSSYFPGKPLMLGEYSFDPNVVEYTKSSFSGYMAWAFFTVPDQPFNFLFDKEERLTDHGKAFAETAGKVAAGEIVFNRVNDAATVEADGVASFSDPRSTMDAYKKYMELCGAAHPVGLKFTQPASLSPVTIRDFVPEDGVCRAKRATKVAAVLANTSEADIVLRPRLLPPAGVRILRGDTGSSVRLRGKQTRRISWVVEAESPAQYKFALEVTSGVGVVASSSLELLFLPPMPVHKLSYIPDPDPIRTDILVGAHNCPLWESDRPLVWAQVRKHPERTPALGFYSQENPEVADWETKWAVEHGVSFFVYCWYRAGQGGPVKTLYSSSIHDALLKSRFVDSMKFTIMWENQARGTAGVSDEKDLMTNLLPFWIDNYFKHPSYLKIDNKPVLFIYRPEFLVDDLGGIENVSKAFDLMRHACVDAGFAGLYILGEYRGLDVNHLRLLKQLGLDYVFAYCWYVPDNPTPEQAVETQMRYIKETQALGVIPQAVTVSQAWSGWADEGTIWKIPPAQFEGLMRQAKEFIRTFPAGELGSKMLLLDNWNEWSEGHYIAPYREYGFGYLDAVRKVFSNAPDQHVDLIPQDIGLGPYDRAYTEWKRKDERVHELAVEKVRKEGADEPGLVAWWAFDEAKDSPAILDYSGHRLGGSLHKTARAKGIDGNALDCNGGCAIIFGNPLLSPAAGMTLECWALTDVAGQDDGWIVNRIFGGKTDTGYRLGLYKGKPCFEIPQTDWSHHLMASKELPVGRWAHLAGTFDGKTMRIYMDGEECGSLERLGPVKPNDFNLCLGSFSADHAAYFRGLLDEVKLYDRALSPDEVRNHSRVFRASL